MATSHQPTFPGSRRWKLRRTGLLIGLSAAMLLSTPSAFAAPNVAEAESGHDAAAAEVDRVKAEVAQAEEALQRMTLEAEAASGEALAARAALEAAETAAAQAAAELATAQEAVNRTRDDVAALGREAYMGSEETYGKVAVLLDADSPGELLQQAATMELLTDQRAETLDQLEIQEILHARADAAAKSAVAERDAAAHKAVEAEAAAKAQLADAQATFDRLTAEKAALDEQLRQAEISLLQARGAQQAQAEQQWEQQRAAAASVSHVAAAAPGGVSLTSGRVTSCYGSRWGTLHAGIDIAAPIGTPIYAPEGGVVLQAGPASGFGLAIAIQHGDGTITVYGHVNQMFVSAGQVVQSGQQIAEVGNRGQSTGPHLHFETHTGGLYANRNNPVPWLASRGISLGGNCG